MTRSGLLFSCTTTLLTLLALPACSSSHNGSDGGLVPDGGRDVPAATCGDEVCGAGEECCPGCPGEPVLGCFASCPDIACPEVWTSCEAALAAGAAGDRCSFVGTCSAGAGGCCSRFVSCVDGALRMDEACAPGCFACATSADCDEGSYCDLTALGCGGPGTCLPRPDGCTDDCPGVCSCSGETFCNACDANAAGQSVAHDGACEAPSCAAQDARGEGECALFLGYLWDGASCTGIGGCSCVGSDCSALYPSTEACEADHAECLGAPCDAMDAAGVGLCDGFFGYAWDGARCQGITGCGCAGSDCGRLYESSTTCEAAHVGCGPEGCAAQAARGEGACRLVLGYRWSGTTCEPVTGCECVGEDCEALAPDVITCERVHAACVDF